MESLLTVEVRLVRDGATLPTYATDGAAGLDLRACIPAPVAIHPGSTACIGSGVAFSIRHKAYVGILAARSGLAVKHGIILANGIGIIDSDYQGEVAIALYNRSQTAYTVQPSERIGQILFMPVTQATLQVVNRFSHASDRGTGGFGSTGRH